MFPEKLKKEIKIILLLVTSCWLLITGVANAASLYFSPSSGSHAIDTTFSVSVYVSSADQAMNAASGVISFPQDKLEVISFSKTGSIISLWVQEPSFSNSAGTINFEGIVLNPGYTGSAGKIITFNFRPKTTGNAGLLFSSGSVLANDGKGTNILTSLGQASFDLTEGLVPTPTPAAGTPSAPEISSITHPDENKWYSISEAEFSWSLPSGITSIRLLIDKKSDTVPTITYTPAIDSKEIKDLDDGLWYFHARFRNSAGWGKVAHFKIQIDTQPPEPFFIKFLENKETDNPRPIILFDTTDSLSGIDYYKIKIGEGDFYSLEPEIVKSNPYTLPLQAPGKRTILVQAFDKAGNYASASEEFTILPPKAPIVEIKESPFVKILSKITSVFVLLIILIAIIVLLFSLIIFFWYVWRRFKRKISKETREVDEGISRAFELLREDMRDQRILLKKAKSIRELTKEEREIYQRLAKNLDDVEKFLQKEVSDIKKLLDT